MKGHLYHIAIEQLEDAKGHAITDKKLAFNTRNHDDLFNIIEKVKQKEILSENDTIDMVIGLKLFSEVMLRNRDNELFKTLQPHMAEFIKQLKNS